MWLAELLNGPKRHKRVSDGSKSAIFKYYIKFSLIYILVTVLSLVSIRLHIMCWDYSWVEVDRRLCHIMLDYWYCFSLLPITLTVAWQLFLVSYIAKVIQLSCCNSSCKGDQLTLHKWLCWEFGVSTIVL